MPLLTTKCLPVKPLVIFKGIRYIRSGKNSSLNPLTPLPKLPD